MLDKTDELVRSLEERFSPSNQTELYRKQLRERRQKAAESLPELGQDVGRLTNLAYPMAPNDVREILTKEQFIDGLASADMRLRVKQARPLNLTMQFDTQWSWRLSIKLNVSVTMDVDTLGQRLKPMKHRNVTHRQCCLNYNR